MDQMFAITLEPPGSLGSKITWSKKWINFKFKECLFYAKNLTSTIYEKTLVACFKLNLSLILQMYNMSLLHKSN